MRALAAPGARLRERDALGVGPELLLVGWLGRMTEIKRVDDCSSSIRELRRRENRRPSLAGRGRSPATRARSARRRARPRATSCHFLGMRESVASSTRAFDAVALTSANEGTPVTLIEALAAGRAGCGTDVGGVVATSLRTAKRACSPRRRHGGFADALERLASDPDATCAASAPKAANACGRLLDPERLVDDVDALYRSLLDERRRTGPRRAPSDRRFLARSVSPLRRSLAAAGRLRVILLSQYFPPEVGATQSRMQSFAEHLADRGHEVTVICEFPNHPHGVIPPAYRGHVVEDDRSNPYRVLRVWVRRRARRPTDAHAVLPFVHGARDARRARWRTCRRRRRDLPSAVHGRRRPCRSRVMNRAPFVLDVRDLWPAAAVSLDQICQAGPRRASGGSRVPLPTGRRGYCGHAAVLRAHRRASRAPGFDLPVPNGTLDMFFDAEPDALRAQRSGARDGEFVVTFAGTPGLRRRLPSVLDAASSRAGDRRVRSRSATGPSVSTSSPRAAAARPRQCPFLPQCRSKSAAAAGGERRLARAAFGPPDVRGLRPVEADRLHGGRPARILSAAGEAADSSSGPAGLVVPPEDPRRSRTVSWLRAHPDEAGEMGVRGRLRAIAFVRIRPSGSNSSSTSSRATVVATDRRPGYRRRRCASSSRISVPVRSPSSKCLIPSPARTTCSFERRRH